MGEEVADVCQIRACLGRVIVAIEFGRVVVRVIVFEGASRGFQDMEVGFGEGSAGDDGVEWVTWLCVEIYFGEEREKERWNERWVCFVRASPYRRP